MSANSRCWEWTAIDEPPVLVASAIGRPRADEAMIEIDACALWCANLSYEYGLAHTKPERAPELRRHLSGHVVETGAAALYFTDRVVILPLAVAQNENGTAFTQGTPGDDINGGDCIIVPARELHLLEKDGLVVCEGETGSHRQRRSDLAARARAITRHLTSNQSAAANA